MQPFYHTKSLCPNQIPHTIPEEQKQFNVHIPSSSSSPWLLKQQTMHQVKANTLYVDSINISEQQGLKFTQAIAHVRAKLGTLAYKVKLCHM